MMDRRDDGQTRGGVCCRYPCCPPRSTSSSSMVPNCVPRLRPGPLPRLPLCRTNLVAGCAQLAYRLPEKFQLVYQLQCLFLCPSKFFLQTFTSPVPPTNTPSLIPRTILFLLTLTVTLLPGWHPTWYTLYKNVPTCDFNSINMCINRRLEGIRLNNAGSLRKVRLWTTSIFSFILPCIFYTFMYF